MFTIEFDLMRYCFSDIYYKQKPTLKKNPCRIQKYIISRECRKNIMPADCCLLFDRDFLPFSSFKWQVLFKDISFRFNQKQNITDRYSKNLLRIFTVTILSKHTFMPMLCYFYKYSPSLVIALGIINKTFIAEINTTVRGLYQAIWQWILFS